MAVDDIIDLTLAILLLVRFRRRRQALQKKIKKRKFWVRSIYQRRKRLGEYHRLFQELKLGDREYFFR